MQPIGVVDRTFILKWRVPKFESGGKQENKNKYNNSQHEYLTLYFFRIERKLKKSAALKFPKQ